jgi:hypothetical protein
MIDRWLPATARASAGHVSTTGSAACRRKDDPRSGRPANDRLGAVPGAYDKAFGIDKSGLY